MEVAGCLFCHIEPWLDPTQLDDLWHFGGHPQTPERRDHIFAHTTHRVMFMGHYHTWLHVTPDAIHPWAGDTPIRLEPETRHMVVIHAISDGYCAPYDTETAVLTPFDLRRDD